MRLGYSLLLALLLVGCETVDITERVVYIDRSPVQHTKVRQWTDTYKGATFTDENGTWSLTVPADVIINLCIENPREGNEEACYESGYLVTPTVESGEDEMIKVEK